MKKVTKQFKLPYKSVSPKIRKTFNNHPNAIAGGQDSHTNSNKKLLTTASGLYAHSNAKKKMSIPHPVSSKPLVHKVVHT